ncbi:MAG: AraC family transcriptional regulator [Rubrivivax sp.]
MQSIPSRASPSRASKRNLDGLRAKRYPPSRIGAMLQVGAEDGIAADALLRDTGLDEPAVRDPQVRTSIEQYVQVGRNVVRLRPDSDFGLRVGARLHLSSYGMYGYALLCTETLRQAFDTGARYHPLTGAVMSPRWIERDDRVVWRFPSLQVLQGERPGLALDAAQYRLFLEIQAMVVVVGIMDIMGTWCTPALAGFALPPPPYAETVAKALGCPVRFGQSATELHYPRAWLDRAPQLANPIAAAQMSDTCAQMLGQLQRADGVSHRVGEELTRTPGRFPDMEAIANTLCMTSRNLRRKLEAEGTSYQALLDGVRQSLARDYLNNSFLGVDDIAAALGFSDAAAFRHAFKRWTGITPTEFRR